MRPRVYKCPECLRVWFTNKERPEAPKTCPVDGGRLRDISKTKEGARLLISHPESLGAELETALLQFMTGLSAFISRESDLCPHCGEKVKKLEPIAASVYLRPCNCRLWKGSVPEAWKKVNDE